MHKSAALKAATVGTGIMLLAACGSGSSHAPTDSASHPTPSASSPTPPRLPAGLSKVAGTGRWIIPGSSDSAQPLISDDKYVVTVNTVSGKQVMRRYDLGGKRVTSIDITDPPKVSGSYGTPRAVQIGDAVAVQWSTVGGPSSYAVAVYGIDSGTQRGATITGSGNPELSSNGVYGQVGAEASRGYRMIFPDGSTAGASSLPSTDSNFYVPLSSTANLHVYGNGSGTDFQVVSTSLSPQGKSMSCAHIQVDHSVTGNGASIVSSPNGTWVAMGTALLNMKTRQAVCLNQQVNYVGNDGRAFGADLYRPAGASSMTKLYLDNLAVKPMSSGVLVKGDQGISYYHR